MTADESAQAATASLELLNRERARVGLPALTVDQSMSDFALDWSRTMATGEFEHSDGPYAENIAWHSNDAMTPSSAADQFNIMWRNSAGHYANMTNSRYTHVGIGLYRHGTGWWATHVFR